MATFTISKSFPSGGMHNKEIVRVHGSLVVASAEGGTSGDLPASLFGLTKLLASGPAITSTGVSLFATSPEAAGAALMAFSDNAATDLNPETYQLWVEGTK